METTKQKQAPKVVNLTDSAITEIKRRIAEKTGSLDNNGVTNSESVGLRLGVKGGGCSGLSYVIDLDQVRDNDLIDLSQGVRVITDPKSALYLKDVTLDYDGGFMGSGFKFINPQASNTCGCGESFSL